MSDVKNESKHHNADKNVRCALDVSDPSTDKMPTNTASHAEEGMALDDGGQIVKASMKTPKRQRGQRLCRFFARGLCTDGDKCKFSHEKRFKKSKKTNCDAKSDAIVASGPESSEPAQHPDVSKSAAAQEPKKRNTRARKCRFFARNECRSGDRCKFSHEITRAPTDTKHKPRRGVVVQIGTPSQPVIVIPNEHNDKDNDEWTNVQQYALDLALRKYPASMDKKKRWKSIASEVGGRTLNECIDRYRMLSDLVRRGIDITAGAEQVVDSRITPPEERIAIGTEPEVKGTQICLEDLFMHKVGTVVVHRLACQVQCDNCPHTFDAILNLDSAEIQKWCPRCSVLHHVVMRPVFAHTQSNVLAYVDADNCSIVDVLPSDMLATCLGCGCEAMLERVAPRQRSEHACFACHTKLALMTRRFLAKQLERSIQKRYHLPDGTAVTTVISKKTVKPVVQNLTLGEPLPRNGTCDHYKHSLRWFRFQCCGKAFPCNVCHDLSDCPEANLGKIASRMICGLCSKEQSSSVKVCTCGNDVGSKRSATHHWEGGKGCRNYTLMSRWDKQKYRGQNKTESTKVNRVGLEGKMRRENAHWDMEPRYTMAGVCFP
ncbi:unnamed protein product [Phytophthora fragariaefolia]|uniref:Unnamed protein product n=1 Tax=Phytophthora fragariaefolia TaxID=1490495 RepID=A0A9W6TYI2_9STRA|nr:unnamed protein product [Phytophthora fragariaefolia]